MFSSLIQKITEHETYGPALQKAADEGAQLALNYHRHQGNDRYCVSICTVEMSPIKVLVSETDALQELVHIEGVAESEDEYLPLCVAFSNALCEHYGMAESFELYFNGEPSPA